MHSWWNDQRMWIIRGPQCCLFCLAEYLLKSIGISTHGFNVTSAMFLMMIKAKDMNNGCNNQLGLIFFHFLGFKEVFRGSNWEGLLVQMFIAGFVTLNCWPIYEALVLRSDKGRIPTKTTMISTLLSYPKELRYMDYLFFIFFLLNFSLDKAKAISLLNIILLKVNFDNLDYIFFLYPLCLQNFQKIKDQ